MDLPMKVKCVNCGRIYRVDPKRRVKISKYRVKCSHCGQIMTLDIETESAGGDESILSHDPEYGLYGEDLFLEIRENFKKLYPMPHVMLKARSIISDPEADFSKISSILKTDQALASRILKVTNSAFFGLSRKVSTIENAAVLLGTKKLIQIINMLSHSKMLKGEMKGYGMDSGSAWRHSLSVAVGSDIIAKKIAPDYSGEAFLSGLLHDAGKVLLDGYLLERNRPFQAFLSRPDTSIVDAEYLVLGLDHAMIGGELCRQWNMPDFVADAITFHHVPRVSLANLLAYVIYSADAIAHAVDSGSVDEALASIDDVTLRFLRFEKGELEATAAQILDSVEILEEDTY